jgi:hypothetical protein
MNKQQEVDLSLMQKRLHILEGRVASHERTEEFDDLFTFEMFCTYVILLIQEYETVEKLISSGNVTYLTVEKSDAYKQRSYDLLILCFNGSDDLEITNSKFSNLFLLYTL